MQDIITIRGQEQIAPFFQRFHNRAHFIGGYVRWMCSPRVTEKDKPGDIDIYPKDAEAFQSINEELVKYFNYKSVFKSDVAESFMAIEIFNDENRFVAKDSFHSYRGMKVQVINPVNQGKVVASGSLDEIIKSFDFTVCMAGLINLQTAKVDNNFLNDEMQKVLRIRNIHCPISAIKRISKYINKGYHIQATELRKLYRAWDEDFDEDYKIRLDRGLSAYEEAGFNIMQMREEDREEFTHLMYID